MTKLLIKIYDSATGQEVEREMNAAEIELYQDTQNKIQIAQKEVSDNAVKKAALLVKLGITADEAALLLA